MYSKHTKNIMYKSYCANSVCCSHALVCGPTLTRPASDGGLCTVCSGQLLRSDQPSVLARNTRTLA